MCISLLDWFEYRNHIVMSFDRFGLSLYDFIKQNHYQVLKTTSTRHTTAGT